MDKDTKKLPYWLSLGALFGMIFGGLFDKLALGICLGSLFGILLGLSNSEGENNLSSSYQ